MKRPFKKKKKKGCKIANPNNRKRSHEGPWEVTCSSPLWASASLNCSFTNTGRRKGGITITWNFQTHLTAIENHKITQEPPLKSFIDRKSCLFLEISPGLIWAAIWNSLIAFPLSKILQIHNPTSVLLSGFTKSISLTFLSRISILMILICLLRASYDLSRPLFRVATENIR